MSTKPPLPTAFGRQSGIHHRTKPKREIAKLCSTFSFSGIQGPKEPESKLHTKRSSLFTKRVHSATARLESHTGGNNCSTRISREENSLVVTNGRTINITQPIDLDQFEDLCEFGVSIPVRKSVTRQVASAGGSYAGGSCNSLDRVGRPERVWSAGSDSGFSRHSSGRSFFDPGFTRPGRYDSDQALARPSSGRSGTTDTSGREEDEDLIPYVLSLKRGRVMCGSQPDVSSVPDEHVGLKLDPCYDGSKDDGGYVVPSDNELIKRHGVRKHLPRTLWPLATWADFSGVPATWGVCLCPSLRDTPLDTLPEIPPPTEPSAPLHSDHVTVPKPKPKRKKVRPKPPEKPEDTATQEERPRKRKTSICIFSSSGKLLHRPYGGTRTSKVVRREIEELERLVKGLGTEGSTCLVVQYQTNINAVKRMSRAIIDDVEGRYPKREEQPPEDIFGLRRFYADHDRVIEEIKRQRRRCLKELSSLEQTLGLADTERRFKTLDITPRSARRSTPRSGRGAVTPRSPSRPSSLASFGRK